MSQTLSTRQRRRAHPCITLAVLAPVLARCAGASVPPPRQGATTASPTATARAQPATTHEPQSSHDAGWSELDAAANDAGANDAAAQGPTASERVRAALPSLPLVAPEEALWFPFRVLETVIRVSGELPAPSAPQRSDEGVVWSLVTAASASRDPSTRAGVCDAVTAAEPRIACAVDVVTVGATERVRLAFAWHAAQPASAGPPQGDLGLILRAFGRLTNGICLVSAERTLHTVDLTVRAPNFAAMGGSLALLSTVPLLADVLLVRAEPRGTGMEAVLSWPTARVDRTRGALARDRWPARCDEHVTVGAGVPPRSPLMAVARIEGENAQGAVLVHARREWLVTVGDQVGDATVTSVTPQGVYVRRATPANARPVLVRYTAPPPTAAATASSAQRPSSRAQPGSAQPPGLPGSGRPRIPLPPEPPAIPPPPPPAP